MMTPLFVIEIDDDLKYVVFDDGSYMYIDVSEFVVEFGVWDWS